MFNVRIRNMRWTSHNVITIENVINNIQETSTTRQYNIFRNTTFSCVLCYACCVAMSVIRLSLSGNSNCPILPNTKK